MFTVQMMGGLGNQMFIYAFARSVEKMGYPIALLNYEFDIKKKSKTLLPSQQGQNTRKLEIFLFNLQLKHQNYNPRYFSNKESCLGFKLLKILEKIYYKKIKSSVITEKSIGKLDCEFLSNLPKNTHFFGYFQNVFFFEHIRNTLLQEFTLRTPLSNKNQKLKEQILSEENSCFLHIRRGDFLDPINWDIYQLGETYYKSAINFLKNKVKNLHIFVFSNDMQWCKKNLISQIGENTTKDIKITFVDNNDEGNAIEDIVLMKHCKHAIMANSTFSWWGGYLIENTEKICVMPNRFFYNPKKEVAHMLVPIDKTTYKEWCLIDPVWGSINSRK